VLVLGAAQADEFADVVLRDLLVEQAFIVRD
jgi:hypothetical protein